MILSSGEEMENWRALEKHNCFVMLMIMVLAWGFFAFRARAASYTEIGSDDFTYTFYVDAAIDYDIQSYDDAIDVVVPLYVNISSSVNIPRFSYLNGIGGLIPSILQQLPCTVNGSVPNFNYFEPVNDNLIIGRIDQNSYIIFNDFYLNYDQSSYYNQILLGYIHYSHSVGGSPVLVRYSNSSYTYTTTTAYSVWYSEYAHGATEAIIDAINGSSDINSIISILQSIQNNTALLSQVVSGISSNGQLLNQILSALNNIDDTIDTVTWTTFNSDFPWTIDFSTFDSSYGSRALYNNRYVSYIKIGNNLSVNGSGLFFIKIPYNISTYAINLNDPKQFYAELIVRDSSTGNITKTLKFLKYYSIYQYTYFFIDCPSGFPYSNNAEYYIKVYNTTDPIYNYSYYRYNGIGNYSFIRSDDIEYYTILSALYSSNLYDLIYGYINGGNNGAIAASQAASNLGSQAAQEAAMEASVAALAPGNLSDLENSDPLDFLSEISTSTSFWGSLVTSFSTVSGVFWGIFIIGLLLGLIAFILRLR